MPETSRIQLGEIAVDVVLKDIKNVHLSVHPPSGHVRISAPRRMSLDTLRLFAISKLDWIKRQQAKLRRQERETPRDYVDRESHYVWGRRYLEYIVVHELVHLLEPTHNAHFVALMDRFMPHWRFRRQVLNRLPVRRETWSY